MSNYHMNVNVAVANKKHPRFISKMFNSNRVKAL